MKRREFITLLGSAAVSWPHVARAQQPVTPVIGILGTGPAGFWAAPSVGRAFQQGLNAGGFVEGQNVALEFRWANNDYGRLPELAADLVRRRVSVVVAIGNNLPARAAKAATSTIPIVFVNGIDPVEFGLVASIGRPGANITGVTVLAADLIQKRMQFLHDVVPAAKVFGFIFNADNAGSSNGRSDLELVQDVVRSWGGSIEFAAVRTVVEFEPAVAGLVKRRIEALATSGDVLFSSGQLAPIIARHSLPAVILGSANVRAGGLMSYNASITDAYQQAGRYVARILHGEKPADLPVQLPIKFELVINLKTAKALGITIPRSLLAAATELID
jgi:putative tryptophan/tyrosine transport system substrate-binding protein